MLEADAAHFMNHKTYENIHPQKAGSFRILTCKKKIISYFDHIAKKNLESREVVDHKLVTLGGRRAKGQSPIR